MRQVTAYKLLRHSLVCTGCAGPILQSDVLFQVWISKTGPELTLGGSLSMIPQFVAVRCHRYNITIGFIEVAEPFSDITALATVVQPARLYN